MEKLAAVDPRKAELVKLRCFVGMNFEEAAAARGIAVPTGQAMVGPRKHSSYFSFSDCARTIR